MLASVKYGTYSITFGKYCYKRAIRDTYKNFTPYQCTSFKTEMVSPLNFEEQYSSPEEISSFSAKLTKIPVRKESLEGKRQKKNLGSADTSFSPDKNLGCAKRLASRHE